jgi:DnaJ-class molecular chaperone
VLIDDQKRPLYDQFGEAGVKRGAGGFGGAPGGFSEVDLGDIFNDFFGEWRLWSQAASSGCVVVYCPCVP